VAVSELVRREVRKRFSQVDAYDIECLLQAMELPLLEQETHRRARDRVHLGILKLANGSFEQFARHLALAASDWRDVLVAAGMGNADWPDVLRAAGYPVP
jgi:hypothetical protein